MGPIRILYFYLYKGNNLTRALISSFSYVMHYVLWSNLCFSLYSYYIFHFQCSSTFIICAFRLNRVIMYFIFNLVVHWNCSSTTSSIFYFQSSSTFSSLSFALLWIYTKHCYNEKLDCFQLYFYFSTLE